MEEHKPEDGNLLIDQYCEGRSKSLLDLAINRRSTEAVRYMLERDLVSQNILSDYLSKSVRTGRVEITALLLEYSSKDRNMSLDPDPFI